MKHSVYIFAGLLILNIAAISGKKILYEIVGCLPSWQDPVSYYGFYVFPGIFLGLVFYLGLSLEWLRDENSLILNSIGVIRGVGIVGVISLLAFTALYIVNAMLPIYYGYIAC